MRDATSRISAFTPVFYLSVTPERTRFINTSCVTQSAFEIETAAVRSVREGPQISRGDGGDYFAGWALWDNEYARLTVFQASMGMGKG